MIRKLFVIPLLILISSCNENNTITLTEGVWRAELQLTETEILPFNFEVTSPDALKIFNADEVIMVTDISYSKDTIVIKTPVFEGYIKAVLKDDSLSGSYIIESLDRRVPFYAQYGNSLRFKSVTDTPQYNVSGNWEAIFSPNSDDSKYIAKGEFEQEGTKVFGTFRTTTGDYRYLEGVMDGHTMKLSAFDGAHAFLFTATVNDSTMSGRFYSGNHWEEPFIAKRNDRFELPSANDLTFLNEGYDALEFSFPDINGNVVSLSDDRFKNKVVVVQIMGSWCPNCLDESRYYSSYYDNAKGKEVEFVALAFEYAKTEAKALSSIKRLQDDVGINYPILLAQVGTSSKLKAQEKLPMLNHILSYPTSIFIDKKGKVRKIHTGFNGPATGEKFTEFKAEFTSFVDELMNE